MCDWFLGPFLILLGAIYEFDDRPEARRVLLVGGLIFLSLGILGGLLMSWLW